MPASQTDEDVFQTGLPRAQVLEPLSIALDRLEQRWNRQVRLANVETYRAVFVAYRLHAGQRAPRIEAFSVTMAIAADLELHNVMSAQAIDQIRRRALGDDHAVIDDRQPVAQALGLIHVVGGEQHRSALLLEGAHD